MHYIKLIRILMLLTPSWVMGLTTVDEAYQCFQKKDYEGAAKRYEELLNLNGGTGDLLYNLGTCYLYLNRIPEARLNLERALIFQPSNNKIKAQILHIHNRIEPKIDALPPFFLYSAFVRCRDLVNSQFWGWLTLISSFLLSGVALWTKNFKTRGFSMLSSIVLILFLSSLVMYFARNKYEIKPRGILKANSPLLIAPTLHSQELIPLGAGTKVEFIDSLNNWWKVQLENNDQGWLPQTGVEKI